MTSDEFVTPRVTPAEHRAADDDYGTVLREWRNTQEEPSDD